MLDSFDPSQCRVALLCGGTSGEREISLASGEGAREALEQAGCNVTVLDPAEKNDLKQLIDEPFDVAFLCLHGRHGEDGSIQGFLETIGLPYTGSGVWASALAINKVEAKEVYRRASIPTPLSKTLVKGVEYDVDALIAEVGEHCVVKPSTEGSSLGVFIVSGAQEIAASIQNVFKYDTSALIERYVEGIELTVAVIGTNEPYALPIIEIIPQGTSYDFDSKYAPGGSEHICPARLSDQVTMEIKDLAVRAHKALGCKGVSRSDFILAEDGSCWILETNTIPGMTSTSLLPDAARAAGITFSDLCTQLITDALENSAR